MALTDIKWFKELEKKMDKMPKDFVAGDADVKKDEKVVGLLSDDLRRFWFAIDNLFEETNRIGVEHLKSTCNHSNEACKQHLIEVSYSISQANALKEAFWESVRVELEFFNESGIGLRKGQVVSIPASESSSRNPIADLLGLALLAGGREEKYNGREESRPDPAVVETQPTGFLFIKFKLTIHPIHSIVCYRLVLSDG